MTRKTIFRIATGVCIAFSANAAQADFGSITFPSLTWSETTTVVTDANTRGKQQR